jgi:head-tail adaptor
MRAGNLRELIQVQKKAANPVSDGQGGRTVVWENFLRGWAEISYPDVATGHFGGSAVDEDVILFKIRYVAGIKRGMRVVWNSETYKIVGARDKKARRTELEVYCTGLRDGS